MTTLIALTAILLLGVCLIAWRKRRRKSGSAIPQLRLHAPVGPEAQRLHQRLLEALPQYRILLKVSLDTFLRPQNLGGSMQAEHRRTLAAERIDFLICDVDYTPLAAVELDDVLALAPEAPRAPEILRHAGLPVLKWNVISPPSVRAIRETIAEIETSRLIHQSQEETARSGSRTFASAGGNRREPRL